MSTNTNTPNWPSFTFRAMGSQITFWLDAAEPEAQPAFEMAQIVFQLNEQALSRFDPESELSQLNGRPDTWLPVSPLLWEVAAQAFRLAEATGGLFDPTLLSALKAAGYAESFELGVTADPDARPGPGRWQEVGLDPMRRAIYLPEGAQLDLGGVAKGFTAQMAADLLGEWGPCLVDAGGDLTAGAPPRGLPGWPVAVAVPAEYREWERRDLFAVWLAGATLATSGVDFRRWTRADGRPAHHIIQPRAGQPADTDLITATVWAEDAAVAEGWATATLVSGMEAGVDMLTQQGLPATLISQQGEVALTPAMRPLVRQIVAEK